MLAVFYISDNNVVTADCIPPSCIVRATCTSTGAVFDLNQFRAKYMRGCAEPTWGPSARAALHLMITLSHPYTTLNLLLRQALTATYIRTAWGPDFTALL